MSSNLTGCSSGMGKALSLLILAKGQRLVATARKLSGLSYLPTNSPNLLTLSLDVTSSSTIDAAVDTAIARFGRIDVMVNNAGFSYRGDTENASLPVARNLFETNFWGTVLLTTHAMRIMRSVNPQSGPIGGCILNITSMGGRVAFQGNAYYHASKFAVEGFTESVSKEVRPEWGIHFCCVEPGGVKTNYVKTGRERAIPVHEAYEGEDSPTRRVERYLEDEEAMKGWADAEVVVERIWELVEGGEVPLRVPLGGDAWGVLRREYEQYTEELERWREFSVSAGKGGQLESIDFLGK
ncbi:hypothetical protein MFIFM68171_07288 [Madurella fahalii]|uniref:Uncharacterized protein n=1 Tax=Madurella fahalii TaxID=1157608 RepID=A0ABQ0GH40_9PEZI